MSIEARSTAFNAFVSACQSDGVGANKAPKQASGSGKKSESISVWALKRRTTSTNQPPAPPRGFDSWVEYTAYMRAWPLRKLVLYYLVVAWWMVILTAHTLTARPLSWSELAILVVAIPPRLQCWAFALAMAVRCLGGPQPFLPWLVDLIRAS